MRLSKNDIEDLKILNRRSSPDGNVTIPSEVLEELLFCYSTKYGAPAQPVGLINKLVQQIRALGGTPNV